MTKESVSKRRKILCSIAISISAILMIFAFCGRYFNSGLRDVANFFVGSFGMAFYGMMIAAIVCSSFLLAGRHIRIPKRHTAHFCLLFVEIVLLVHLFSTIYFCYTDGQMTMSFQDYAKTVYNHYVTPTFGGVVFGVIDFGLQKVITIYATAIILFGLLAWSVVELGLFFNSYFTGKLTLTKPAKQSEPVITPEVIEPVPEIDDDKAKAYEILFKNREQTISPESDTHVFNTAPQSRLDRRMPSTPEEAKDFLFNSKSPIDAYFTTEVAADTNDEMGAKSYQSSELQPQTTPQEKEEDVWRIVRPSEPAPEPKPAPMQTLPNDGWITPAVDERSVDVADVVVQDFEESEVSYANNQPPIYQQPAPVPQPELTPRSTVTTEPQQAVQPLPQQLEDFEFEEYPAEEDEIDETETVAPPPVSQGRDAERELVPVEKETKVPGGVQMGFDFRTPAEIREAKEKVHKYARYVTPPTELLNDATIIEDDGEYDRNMAAAAIVNKLAVFGIRVEPAGQVVGPSVTRYMFKVVSQKTRMSEFNQYAQDLKACLEAEGEIRIEAPIHGTNLVGIEVANKVRTPVTLRTVLESKSYKEKKGNLVFVVGQQISGEMVVDDLSKLPHLLVAGTTGSGKSVFLHSLIASLMYRYGPEYLRFIMVDPKLVEFGRYNGIPHMLTTETIINATDALAAMDYLVAEMESRYQLLRQYNVANIADYNAKINPKLVQRLPYLVLIVDELADLMSVSKKSFEAKLQRLAQKARAAGIHLVLATQRPDVQVISGTIKTNFPCRIALKVASATDSGTILNGGGAEKLLGYGDLLYMHPSRSDLQRIQGTYLADEEINALVEYIKSQNESYYDADISKEIFVSQQPPEEEVPVERADSKDEQIDPYCKRALRFWLERQGGRASIASIQRSLKIGFNRAGRIMDTLQKLHYVEELAPNDTSSKPLRVLVTLDQLDELFPDQESEY